MKFLFVIFILFAPTFLYSQLNANAGEDTTICVTWDGFGPFVLGGTPTASGGLGPYTYIWECNYIHTVGSFSTNITASDVLSDTTISNPEFVNAVGELNFPITFTLTVTDNLSQTVSDSITVSFSVFNTNLTEYTHGMFAGDSVEFVSNPNVGGGIAPVNYTWRPNNGLTDSTSYTNFWLKPIISTSYYITAKDAVGCVVEGSPVFHIYINYLGIDDLLNSPEENIIVYPNPTNGKVLLKNKQLEIEKLKIFNHLGALLQERYNFKDEEIDLSNFQDGAYTIVFTIDGVCTSKTIIKAK